jgi:hypothetical protein
LIRLGIIALSLDIDLLLDASFSKNVVTSFGSLGKAGTFEQNAQIVETNGSIRCTTQNSIKSLLLAHAVILCRAARLALPPND